MTGTLELLEASALFAGGLVLLAVFVYVAARALMLVANARTHSMAADEQEDTLRAGRAAVREIKQRNVEARKQTAEERDAEIQRAIEIENLLAARDAAQMADEGGEPMPGDDSRTTFQNEEIEEESPLPVDSFYNEE